MAAFALVDDPFQFAGHAPQVGHAGMDIGQVGAGHPIHIAAGQSFVAIGQLQQAADLLQAKPQVPPGR